jgi:peptide/nickel transport system substrate-binding protein
MKKQLSLVLAAVMVAASLVACGGSSQPAATTAAAAPAETQAAAAAETQAAAPAEAAPAASTGKTDLTIINTVEPQTLLPGSENLSAGHLIQCQIYDTLVMETPGARSTLVPGLATEWEYSEDGCTITFTLREGVKFHDGTEMTADDVVFSLKKDAEGSYNADAAKLLASIEKVDDKHIAVSTNYAYKPFLQVLAMPSFGIYSQKWYEDCEASGTNMARSENGTGAYKFAEWQSGDYLKLEAFDDYWGGAPTIKNVTMKIMTDGQTAALSMQSGEADVFFGLDSADYDTMKATPHMVVWDVLSNGTHFLALNSTDGHFFKDNKDARKAVQHSLNREEINLGGLDGTGHVTPYPVNPDHFGYDPDWQPTPFDLDKAKELLAGTGYSGETVIYKSANSSWYQNPAQVMAEEMRKAGFNIDLQIMERGAWEDDVDAKGNSDIWNYMTWGQFPDADADLYIYLHTSQRGIEYANMIDAGNEECDAALDGGRYSVDDEERFNFYKQVADINEEEGWYAFLMTGCNFAVTTDAVQGFVPHPAVFYHIKDWSL